MPNLATNLLELSGSMKEKEKGEHTFLKFEIKIYPGKSGENWQDNELFKIWIYRRDGNQSPRGNCEQIQQTFPNNIP